MTEFTRIAFVTTIILEWKETAGDHRKGIYMDLSIIYRSLIRNLIWFKV
jgi:hypothetical protein